MGNRKAYIKIKESWGRVKSGGFNFQLIKSYFINNDNATAFQVVSDRLIQDIDFEELFMFLDRTQSKIGQQYLYDSLLTIDLHRDFSEQEKWIAYYLQNEDSRIQTQLQLSKLNKHEAYFVSSLFQDEYIKKPKWFWLIPVLFGFNILCLILVFIIPKLLVMLVLLIMGNLSFHLWNKRNIYVYADTIPQLLSLMKVVKGMLKTHPNGPVASSLKSLEIHKPGMRVFSLESKSDSDVFTAAFVYVLELLKVLFLLEPLIVFRVLKKLDKKRNDIHKLFRYLGRIDMAVSLASLRAGLPFFCKPEASEEHPLSFEEIYHPLIADCVANSLHIDGKSVLLTGSNMSGKTTFIRTVAINALCAQTINTCFAQKFSLKPMQVFSAIRITDDLMSDKSYYFEEVLTIKQIINESQASHYKLFLLDEIFKGTNTVERIAAGKAVLSYIGKGNNIVFVSSHDIELTDLLRDTYDLYHFTEAVENGAIFFDYKLKKGNLGTRNAIRILELNDYPAELIREAKEISKTLLPLIGS